jgi:hypothetical protein
MGDKVFYIPKSILNEPSWNVRYNLFYGKFHIVKFYGL